VCIRISQSKLEFTSKVLRTSSLHYQKIHANHKMDVDHSALSMWLHLPPLWLAVTFDLQNLIRLSAGAGLVNIQCKFANHEISW